MEPTESGTVKQQQQRLYSACLRNLAGTHHQLEIMLSCSMILSEDNYISILMLQDILMKMQNDMKDAYSLNKDKIC